MDICLLHSVIWVLGVRAGLSECDVGTAGTELSKTEERWIKVPRSTPVIQRPKSELLKVVQLGCWRSEEVKVSGGWVWSFGAG